MWNASRFCVSSLRRGHANLLCIVPILVYVPPKRVREVASTASLYVLAGQYGISSASSRRLRPHRARPLDACGAVKVAQSGRGSPSPSIVVQWGTPRVRCGRPVAFRSGPARGHARECRSKVPLDGAARSAVEVSEVSLGHLLTCWLAWSARAKGKIKCKWPMGGSNPRPSRY